MKHLLLTTIAAVILVGCGPDIHDAAYFGNIEAAKRLIAEGVDVNAELEGGSTPLHLAVQEGHKEIVELLIANGADVNAKREGGETPLDVAITRHWTHIADLLRKHGGKAGAEDSIHVAARIGNIKAVREHLDDGADVNVRDEDESTPLHQAAFYGYVKTTELLVDKGADVNAKNDDGRTPLDRVLAQKQKRTIPSRRVRRNDHPEIADLLRKHGGKTCEELKVEGK